MSVHNALRRIRFGCWAEPNRPCKRVFYLFGGHHTKGVMKNGNFVGIPHGDDRDWQLDSLFDEEYEPRWKTVTSNITLLLLFIAIIIFVSIG